jgi:hypothetical protein
MRAVLILALWCGLAAAQVQITTINGTIYANADDFVLRTLPNGGNVSLGALAAHLAAESVRLDGAQAHINSVNGSLISMTSNLGVQLSTASGLLSVAVASEQSRATQTEQSLASAINSSASRASSSTNVLTDAIAAEVSRAVLAENALSVRLDASISAGVSRTTFVQLDVLAAVSLETSRALTAESQLSAAVVAERVRAIEAEASIGVVASVATADRLRAILAENAINASVVQEIARALLQEQSIAASVNEERLRAIAAEASIGVVDAAVTAERLRAINIEGAISTTVAAVSTRLASANTALSAAVVAEESRSLDAVNALTSGLGAAVGQVNVQLSCARQGLVLQPDNTTCGVTTAPMSTVTNVFNTLTNMAQCPGTVFTAVTVSSIPMCRRSSLAATGCSSIYVNPGRIYTQVTGYLTLYQSGTPDGFFHNDMVSIWSGNTPIMAFAMGYTRFIASAGNCPAQGGAGPTNPWAASGNWQCDSGFTATTGAPDSTGGTVYTTPVFGPSGTFTITVPPTSSQIEIRLCTDQSNGDENILIGASTLSVLSPPTLTTPFRNILNLASDATSCAQGTWTAQAIGGLTLCRRAANAGSGCGSIWVSPGGPYTQVTGSVSLYQFFTTDAFNSGQPLGDSVTIWAGSTLLWVYTVGGCPVRGAAGPPSAANGQWACAFGFESPVFPGTNLFNQVLFGPPAAFTVQLPPTQAQIEIRMCLDQGVADEEIYLSAASLSVR